MDILIVIMAAFAVAGLFDDLFGNKLGLGDEFGQGLSSMGRLALSMVGFYCIGISFVQSHANTIAALSANLPFDPSLITSCILCADIGGLPIAQRLAATPAMGVYTGALIGGGLGMTMGFQFPVFLSVLDKEQHPILMRGVIYGLIALPAGLAAGGALLGLTFAEWLTNTLPVLVLCVVLIIAFLIAPKGTVKVLTGLGSLVRILSYMLFALTLLGVFLPQYALAETQLVEEILYSILRTTIVACGGLVLAKLAIKYLNRPLTLASNFLGTNSEAVIGMLLSCFQSIAMLPLFPQMDRKGKIMNAAFAVCGAYMMGGQMAFVSLLVPEDAMIAYMANKIICGVVAVAIACLLERPKRDEEGSPSVKAPDVC